MEKKFLLSELGVDENIDNSITELIKEAMGMNRNLEWIRSRTDSDNRKSLFCAYIVKDSVVCVNFFTPFEFIKDNQIVLAHQSGFSATKVGFKGKGLWTSLMTESKQHLSFINSKFIFGFPNGLSAPIFTKKLEYEMDYLKMDVFNFWLLIINRFVRRSSPRKFDVEKHYASGYEDLMNWQSKQRDKEFIYEQINTPHSKLWGKIRVKNIWIFKIRFLEIGGYQATTSKELENLIISSLKENGVSFGFYARSIESNISSLRNFSYKYSQPIVYTRLDKDLLSFEDICFTGANRDVF